MITKNNSMIRGIWVLDSGIELRYYLDSTSLAKALFDGYGSILSTRGSRRKPSLQWFGIDGHVDATSEFLNRTYANNQPDISNDSTSNEAQLRFINGDKADWIELRKKSDKLDSIARKELAIEIEKFRLESL